MLSAIGVRTYPGQMALTRIPDCAYSTASDLVRPTIAAFVKAYAVSPGSATISPVTEDIITIRPSLRAIISGSTAFVTFHTPFILISIWKSRSSSLISRKLPRRQTPALFTRISMRPSFSLARLIAAATDAGSRTSATTAVQR
ncbi:hypothetical protein HmCmsJML291_01974 [Escherichia coli]|nr:hypothetical protein HmCmsJML291_01974 [Escherichia coli]